MGGTLHITRRDVSLMRVVQRISRDDAMLIYTLYSGL